MAQVDLRVKWKEVLGKGAERPVGPRPRKAHQPCLGLGLSAAGTGEAMEGFQWSRKFL